MKRSRTGSSSEKAPEGSAGVTVTLSPALRSVLAETKQAFFGFCVAAGQEVLTVFMEEDRLALCGPPNVPNPDRLAYRGGSAPGEVVLGGRRIVVPRLRARRVGGGECLLPSFAAASAEDPLDDHTLDAVAIGVATRKYARGLDPLPPAIPESAVSKSAVSRRFVALTTARLTAWLTLPLDDLACRIILIDGLHFRDHIVLLALGIAADGTKHVLALREGTTENAAVCTALLRDLRTRGLDLDRPTLFIIDGGTGLRKAIRETCGPLGVVQRCQVHKLRNVLEHLPEAVRPRIQRALRQAYALADAAKAKRRLAALAKELAVPHPGAASSLREGLDETLTLQTLGLTGALYRTLRSTNAIENLNSLVGRYTRNVHRWRHGHMLVRWIASALHEARRSFRRIRGHTALRKLFAALDRQALPAAKEVA
jgi:putative transposase